MHVTTGLVVTTARLPSGRMTESHRFRISFLSMTKSVTFQSQSAKMQLSNREEGVVRSPNKTKRHAQATDLAFLA